MSALTVVRPASQGLTVWRSDEATSNGWPAISARAKSETRFSRDAPRSALHPQRRQSRADGEAERGAVEAASANQARRGPAGRRTGRSGRPAGALARPAPAMRAVSAGGAASQRRGAADRLAQRRRAAGIRPRAPGLRASSRSNSSALIASSSPSRAALSRSDAVVGRRSWLGFQHLCQRAAGAGEAGHDGADRRAGRLGDVAVGEAVDVAQTSVSRSDAGSAAIARRSCSPSSSAISASSGSGASSPRRGSIASRSAMSPT